MGDAVTGINRAETANGTGMILRQASMLCNFSWGGEGAGKAAACLRAVSAVLTKRCHAPTFAGGLPTAARVLRERRRSRDRG